MTVPSHRMPTSCESNRIGLIEARTRKACQCRLEICLWLTNARGTSHCSIYTPSAKWDWRSATSPDSHCRAKCYNICHCSIVSECPTIRSRNWEPTGSLSADEESEDEERIIKGCAHVFWAVGLKSDGGVDAACPSSNICSHEVIYGHLVPFPSVRLPIRRVNQHRVAAWQVAEYICDSEIELERLKNRRGL